MPLVNINFKKVVVKTKTSLYEIESFTCKAPADYALEMAKLGVLIVVGKEGDSIITHIFPVGDLEKVSVIGEEEDSANSIPCDLSFANKEDIWQ